MLELPETLTVEEAQAATGCHRNTVIHWIRKGIVSAIKDGRKWRLSTPDVLRIMQWREGYREAKEAGHPIRRDLLTAPAPYALIAADGRILERFTRKDELRRAFREYVSGGWRRYFPGSTAPVVYPSMMPKGKREWVLADLTYRSDRSTRRFIQGWGLKDGAPDALSRAGNAPYLPLENNAK